MSDTTNVEIPRPRRGEGQWGLGYFEPLNTAERIKRDLDGLKSREFVEDYARGGFRSIDKANLRSRLRWWGLYTQRPPHTDAAQRDHVGAFDQRDGNRYVGFAPRAGRIYGHQLRIVADLAERYGSGLIRNTTQQKMVILDVPPEREGELVEALAAEDLAVHPSAFRKGTMACTGIEFCKLAIVETKARAQWLYQELEERLPDFDEELRINVNGCPNSCARFQIADIGLMGCQLPRLDGTRSDGFLIHLGGGLSGEAGFGRKPKGVRVFAEDLADYTEDLLRRYLTRKASASSFGEYVNSLSTEELAAFAEPVKK